MTIWCEIHSVRHANPPHPEQKVRARSHVQNWNDQPANKRCATVSTVNKWFAVTPCGRLISWWWISFFWNLVSHTKLSTSIGWHDTQTSKYYVSTHSFLGPANTNAMFMTGNSLSRHRFSRRESATLKKLCGPVLLLFHTSRYFNTKFDPNPILRAQRVKREPLIFTTHPRISDPAAHLLLCAWIT